MPKFVYIQDGSNERGYNVSVRVYELKQGKRPEMLGVTHHNTASWKGARGQAAEIIAKAKGYKTTRRDPYSESDFVRKDLVFWEL